MGEIIVGLIILIVVAGLIMVATDILYTLAVHLVPLIALVLVAVGIVVGFVVAVKNTFSVYRKVYGRKKV